MNHRSVRLTIAATCAFVLAGIGASAAGAADGGAGEPPVPIMPPSLPIPLPLFPSTTVQSLPVPPAGSPDLDGAPATPAVPEPGALPATPLPGAGAAGDSDAPTDPCAQITGPAAEQGAPIAATCPIIPSDDGGADIPICVDIAKVATCNRAASATTTTTTTTTTPSSAGTGSTGGTGSAATGSGSSPSGSTATEPSSTSTRGTGGTLPLTGSAIVWLLTIGTALAATGGTLARVARRRFS
jgi:hypothetical protein